MEDGELSASDREESAREDEDEFTGGGGGSHAEVEAVSEGSDNDSEEVKGVFQDEEEEQEEDGDRINEEKLRTLGTSSQLRDALSNPHLRRLLVEIDGSADPQRAIQRAMAIPVFVEFADECLRVCGLREEPEEGAWR